MALEKLTLAQVNWIDEIVPHSEQFDDFYFNTEGGLQEIEHTFIGPNRLTERFSDGLAEQTFRIAETGFGSGLNFLAVSALWLAKSPANGQLHFISFEKFPMPLADLQKAHRAYPQLLDLAKALQNHYPLLLPGWHDLWLFKGRVRLTLWFGDVLKGLPECDASPGSRIDAWLLDGFTPSKNPDMWRLGLYKEMSRLSHAQTSFSTFTSAGDVRRGLQAAGFSVHKAGGYGKKREMCFGHLAQVRPYSLKAPWFSRPEPIKIGTAIVVGAGLAGASVAYQLAKAGWKVTVLEENPSVASAASGNLAGTVHPLITADWNLRSQWYLQGFEATLRTLLPWLESNEIQGDLQGLVQLLVTKTSLERVQESLSRVGLPKSLALWLTTSEVSEKIGGQASAPGLFFPQGGWLNPPSVVKRCLQHESILVSTSTSVKSIEKISDSATDPAWSVATQSKKPLQMQASTEVLKADIVVVATGSLNRDLNTQLGLPIRPVKGQVSYLEANQQNYPLKYPLTHAGYSSPCGNGKAITGATFEAPSLAEELSIEGHLTNLETAHKALPNWVNASAESLQGRVAFRPTTPDHLPIFGAVPDKEWLQEAYLSQSHTHAVYRYQAQRYQKGLYVSNGHGPRGLLSVFLAAESILAELQGSALVQPLSLYYASHPARFTIRAWRSGKLPKSS
ncbi:MAG: bifunctional tRNA (5-methylaminomethyl-2-thiouridine)(34)-methyltransferase MnmD/FAD-dependent 5-carboxymethylaminomethyl-2-thiouridine(34) oxidoreductase MnmC [Pseudomonadota bacterium]